MTNDFYYGEICFENQQILNLFDFQKPYFFNQLFFRKTFLHDKNILFLQIYFLINIYVSTVVENYFEHNTISLKYRKPGDKKSRLFVVMAPHLRSAHDM